MAENAPHSQSTHRKKRRRPKKKAWHEQPWLIPTLFGGCALLLVFTAIAWWVQRVPGDPVEATSAGNRQIQENVRDFYKGNYALLDQATLQEEELLPEGIQVQPKANQMVSKWGAVEVMGSNSTGKTQPPYNHFIIVYHDIPQQACEQIAAQMMAQYLKVWIGHNPPKAVDEEVATSQEQASALCKRAPTSSIMGLGK